MVTDPAESTPLYLLDLARVRDQAAAFRDAFPPTQPFYSTKTNPHPRVVDLLGRLGFGFDAATVGEIAYLRDRGIAGERMVFTHPARSREEIAFAAGAGVRKYVFDTPGELRALAAIVPRGEFLLRLDITPFKTTFDYSGRFGVDSQGARAILTGAVRDGIAVAGIAFHVGSQTVSASAWEQPMALACSLLREFGEALPTLRTLNVGSGFPIDYDRVGVPELG